ncbi:MULTISPECIES: FecR domain-containing protein [unclassified Pseudomonas]|uniref:FecR domain-containing protein n=1 Tax=unclassified Pseudomonas TaxID=196821 RepID=UPI000C86C544|nr:MULTISPECIES: FecR domain-containing protein [unclassified Pseudomonas]PMV17917.1 sugar ABC transporter substrate-binding protein [Pseudomonas sp. FW305-3-2-15-C-TSA2]PMV18845.1 sugar ABC transporter substrate-binding protein [Pseudomonas sp. DP16D-L5]PMV34917.1 sugar ABC transporter substrate-binding protein [Pseudomonas sp. FW305-3-2-15-A-LB2]PMV38661.1 sugar ABC transporter substrate-binding protein [Pseudomonas sp. FW305-3-2-15-C-R2A1]PMV42734.1 sugar ABC transporter substrate-binding p
MSRDVARAAAQWLALLESGAATERDHAALQHWRDSHPQHEQTWQKAQTLRQRFSDLPQALAMASLDRPQPGRRAVLKRALGIAALVPTAWLVSRQLPIEAWRADLHTATGERRRMSLADGGSLQLNTATAVDMDLAQRRITLVDGELALNVPGPSAMTVQTRYGELRVSQAEVCVRQMAKGCLVSVLQGSVQVRDLNGQMVTLPGGRQASLQADGLGAWAPFDVLQPGWRDGVLTAQNQTLGDFLRELERYRPGVLRWDPSLETLRVTGSFRLDDTDRILNLLAQTLGLEVQARTRYWVTLRKIA